MKSWFGHVSVHIALFVFLPRLLRKKSKYGKDIGFSLVLALGKLLGGIGGFIAFSVWQALFQAVPSGEGSVLSWSHFQASGILSSPMSQGHMWFVGISGNCSCGAFGWVFTAPLLHHTVWQAFFFLGLFAVVVGSRGYLHKRDGDATADQSGEGRLTRSPVSCSCQAGSMASNAKAMEKVALARIHRSRVRV